MIYKYLKCQGETSLGLSICYFKKMNMRKKQVFSGGGLVGGGRE
jgi:hypothetical protein